MASEKVRTKMGKDRTAIQAALRQYRSRIVVRSPRANSRAAAGVNRMLKV